MRSEQRAGSRFAQDFLQFAFAWNFVVAQPIFSVLENSPTFFVAHKAEENSIVLFALGLAAACPALLAAVSASLPAKAAKWLRGGVLLAFTTIGAFLIHRKTEALGPYASAVAILLVALTIGWLYVRKPGFRTALRWGGAFSISFPLVFLFQPSVRPLWWSAAELEKITGPDSRIPVVVLIFDELPLVSLLDDEGEIDAELFPSFRRLASQSTWFRNAVTVSDATHLAVPAILTGRYPAPDKSATWREHPENLFTWFAGSYHVRAFEAATELCPTAVCGSGTAIPQMLARLFRDTVWVYLHMIVPQKYADRLPAVSENWADFARPSGWRDKVIAELKRGGRVPDFRAFLDNLLRDEDPLVVVAHLLLPHVPLELLPSTKRYQAGFSMPGRIEGEQWGQEWWPIVHVHQRHLLQVAAVDRLVGELIDRLESGGIYEKAVLVITADHGISFRPGDNRRLATRTNVGEIAFVPLFIKTPGQSAGEVRADFVETVDILPTIAALLGQKLPFKVDGRAILPKPAETRAKAQILSSIEKQRVLTVGHEALVARADALKEQHQRFLGNGPRSLFQIGRFAEIVGADPAAFPTSSEVCPNVSLHVGSPSIHFDPGSEIVPAYVRGSVQEADSEFQRALALSVNDRIVSVTGAWPDKEREDLFLWEAMLPEWAFRRGENKLRIYSVATTANGYSLQECLTREERGFYALEGQTERFRWTNGDAVVTLPVKSEARALHVAIHHTGPNGANLEITVNGRRWVEEHAPPGSWSGTLELSELEEVGRIVKVRIQSSTFIPAEVIQESGDERTLGVAVSGVWVE